MRLPICPAPLCVRLHAMSPFKQFIFGAAQFQEREEYLEFQYKFLIVLILAVIGAVGFFLGALLWVEQAPSPARFVAPALNMAVSLALWLWLRGHKERLQTAAWVLEAVCFAVCVSALVLVPNDALRIIWLFINVPCVYILLGQKAGAMVTLSSMLLLLAGNPFFVAPYSGTELVDAVMGMGLLGFLFHVYRARSMSVYHRLQDSKERLRAMASTDVLTGLLNARAYYERCDQFLLATRRRRSPFSVLFIDLDHFKAINDRHGHAVGDAVLQCVGRLVAQGIRQSDLAGRIGGEEFSVLLPDTDAQGALVLAEALRRAIEAAQPEANGSRLYISASIGVALGGMAEQTIQDIQHQADLAMYEAKAAGRNRITLFQPPQVTPATLAA